MFEKTPYVKVWNSQLAHNAALFILAIIIYKHFQQLMSMWVFTTDDAFISFRYARNLGLKGSLVWNVGESPPVEGYSNFLWVLIAAIFERISGSSIAWMKGLGAASCLGTVLLSFLISSRLTNPFVGLVPPVFLLYLTGFHYWAVSGMETSFFVFLVLLSVLQLVELREDPSRKLRWMILGFTFFLISITHLEGMIFGGFALVWLLLWLYKRSDVALTKWKAWQDPVAKGLLIMAVTFLGLLCIYHLWHLAFYGHLFPNTYYCKKGAASAHLGKPQVLVRMLYGSGGFFLGLILLGLHKRDFLSLHCISLVFTYTLLLWNKDPIIGYFNRHIMALLVYMLVIATAYLWMICYDLFSGHRWRPTFLFIGLSSMFLLLFYSNQEIGKSKRWANGYQYRNRIRKEMGLWLKEHVKPKETIVLGDCGVIPYYFEGNVIDIYCLNNTEFVHKFGRNPKKYVNYLMEKRKPKWLVMRRDDHLVPYRTTQLIYRHPQFTQYQRMHKLRALQGGVEYEVFRLAKKEVLFDFLKQIKQAKVTFHYKNKPLKATMKNGKFLGSHSWEWVGRHRLPLEDGQPDCIWSHPLAKGAKIEIVYPKTPLGRKITFHLGIPRGGLAQAGLRFKVQMGNWSRFLRFPSVTNKWGDYTFSLPKQEASSLPTKRRTLKIEIWGTKRIGRAWICWRGQIEN